MRLLEPQPAARAEAHVDTDLMRPEPVVPDREVPHDMHTLQAEAYARLSESQRDVRWALKGAGAV